MSDRVDTIPGCACVQAQPWLKSDLIDKRRVVMNRSGDIERVHDGRVERPAGVWSVDV